MLQSVVHYGIHFIVPVVISLIWFKNQWKLALVIMLSTMLIDLDHLLATPIFDANRCSINFHPLHSYYAIACYFLLSLIKKTRILGIGCVIHMIADGADCLMM